MIRGNKRKMQPTASQTLELRASIHNRFDIEVLDAATGELKQRARGFNVICNALWDRLLGQTYQGNWYYYPYFNYILFGKGSGTPAATDTALFSLLGAVGLTLPGGVTFSVNRRTGLCSAQALATLNAEQYVGETLTEVGIGYDSTHCVTHAMLEDMNGNPITITKTDTDVIKIYATIYIHWPAGGWYGGSINIAEQTEINESGYYGFLRMLAGAFSSGTKQINFASVYKAVNVEGVSVNLNKYPTVSRSNKTISTTMRLSADAANIPIRFLPCNFPGSEPALDIVTGSWFTPSQISGEAVGTGNGSAKGFSTAFPVKTGSKVYVDGVEASGVTIRTGPANVTRLEQWWNQLASSGAASLTTAGTPLFSRPINYGADGLYIYLNAGHYSNAWENPFSTLGIAKLQLKVSNGQYALTIQASDDCALWSTVGTKSAAVAWSDFQIPDAYKTKKYWRFYNGSGWDTGWWIRAVADVADTAHNIVFETAPAAGAVITCDYVPDCVAKDSNHVFDLTLVLTLGEYQEA